MFLNSSRFLTADDGELPMSSVFLLSATERVVLAPPASRRRPRWRWTSPPGCCCTTEHTCKNHSTHWREKWAAPFFKGTGLGWDGGADGFRPAQRWLKSLCRPDSPVKIPVVSKEIQTFFGKFLHDCSND